MRRGDYKVWKNGINIQWDGYRKMQNHSSLLTPLSTVQELHAPVDASTSPSLISITHHAPPFTEKKNYATAGLYVFVKHNT